MQINANNWLENSPYMISQIEYQAVVKVMKTVKRFFCTNEK